MSYWKAMRLLAGGMFVKHRFLTLIKSVPQINSSSHIHVSRLLPAETHSICLFAHLLDCSFSHLFGWSSALDLSPNSNLFVAVVVIDYKSASLSMASFLCIEEFDWLHFLFEIYLCHWSTQWRINNLIWAECIRQEQLLMKEHTYPQSLHYMKS